jgi:hypothetical protein
MLEHPWRTIELIPLRLWNLYAKDVEGFYWNEVAEGAAQGGITARPMFLLKLFAELYYLSILAMSAAGVFSLFLAGKAPFPRAVQSALGLGLVAYFTLVMMLLFGSSRLHFPMIPCLAWYAGGWLASRVTAMESHPQLAAPLRRAWS